jgi:hypothetical protein
MYLHLHNVSQWYWHSDREIEPETFAERKSTKGEMLPAPESGARHGIDLKNREK